MHFSSEDNKECVCVCVCVGNKRVAMNVYNVCVYQENKCVNVVWCAVW